MTPLLNWLCAACMARHDQGQGQVLSAVAMDVYPAPPGDQDLRRHRQGLLYAKLPDLQAPVTPLHQAAYLNLLGHLVNEQQLTRQDAKERAIAVKTPGQYYGPTLVKHMRLAQVDTESELSPVHHDLAKANKKGLVRQIQQLHLDVLCSTQGKAYIKLPIVPGISERLHLADWYMRSLDDLTLGINVFVLGGCTQADVTTMEEMVSAYDLAASTTGASYNNMKVIMATKNVHISTSYAHARLDLQCLEMLMRLYWGDQNAAVHAVVQYQYDFDGHTSDLMEYTPQSPYHALLVPGLVLCYFTAYLNLWVGRQLETATRLVFPDEVHRIWLDLIWLLSLSEICKGRWVVGR